MSKAHNADIEHYFSPIFYPKPNPTLFGLKKQTNPGDYANAHTWGRREGEGEGVRAHKHTVTQAFLHRQTEHRPTNTQTIYILHVSGISIPVFPLLIGFLPV